MAIGTFASHHSSGVVRSGLVGSSPFIRWEARRVSQRMAQAAARTSGGIRICSSRGQEGWWHGPPEAAEGLLPNKADLVVSNAEMSSSGAQTGPLMINGPFLERKGRSHGPSVWIRHWRTAVIWPPQGRLAPWCSAGSGYGDENPAGVGIYLHEGAASVDAEIFGICRQDF